MVDPATGETLDYVHGKRSKERNADILLAKLVHHFDRDVVHLSYRHFQDDWGTRSGTAEVEYRYKTGRRFNLRPPHIRVSDALIYAAI